MPRKVRELKADLQRAGFTMRPGKGSHTVWSHAGTPTRVTLAGHDGDDAQPYQEKRVAEAIAELRRDEEAP